jgi:hypothetical protein
MTKRTLIGAALAALLAIPTLAWATSATGSAGCPCPPSDCPMAAHKR